MGSLRGRKLLKMPVHLVRKATVTRYSETKYDLIEIRKSYKSALLRCIKENFRTIENVFPFYDEIDEIGNNLYYRDTPKGKLGKRFFLDWYDHKTLSNFHQLNCYDVKSLQWILNIQDSLIYPNYNGEFEETYYFVETWEIK